MLGHMYDTHTRYIKNDCDTWKWEFNSFYYSGYQRAWLRPSCPFQPPTDTRETFSNYFWGVNQTIVHAYSWIKKNQNAKQSWQLKNQRTAYDKRVDGFSKERGDFSSVDHVFVRIFLFYGLVGIRRLNPVSASCRVRMGGGNDAWNDMRDPCTITMYVYYYKLISKAWVNYPPLSKVITNINKDYLCG